MQGYPFLTLLGNALEALEVARNLPPTAANIVRLTNEFGGEVARWAFTQVNLRSRAKNKFALADSMLFDPDALEMATPEATARFHASLFPTGTDVYDLTAGIGADTIALARRGPVKAWEIDQERFEYLQHNLGVHGVEAHCVQGDCFQAVWGEYLYTDPARRSGGEKLRALEDLIPNPLEIAERAQVVKLAILKLSPMLHDKEFDRISPHRVFVGTHDQCSEGLALVGTEASGGVRAHHVPSGEWLEPSDEWVPETDHSEQFFYHAHPAAIRCGGLQSLANKFGLELLGDSNGYLTGATAIDSPWLKTYQVVTECKGDVDVLRKTLVGLDAATPEIKSRAGIDGDSLRKKLKLKGKRTLSVAAYNVDKSLRFVILDPFRP